MSFLDDEFDIPDAPDVPEAPNVPDLPDAPGPVAGGTPDTPSPGTTPEQNEALSNVTIDGDPASNVYKPPEAPAPSVQVQQDIANLNDNSDLDNIKGSGPAATASTRDVGGVSKTSALAQQTLNGGEQNMSPVPGSKTYTAGDFTGAGGSGGGGGTGGVPGGVPGGGGIINGAMDWAKANPQLAAALATGGMGALAGAGKAALDKQTMERKTQLEQANAESLFAYKQEQSRNFAAAGTVAAPNMMQPNTGIINGGLKRPSGANVFGANGRLQR